MNDSPAGVIDELLAPDAFFVPPPGRVSVERGQDRWEVRLHRPDVSGFPLDHPIIVLRLADLRIEVTRHLHLRDDGWIAERVGTVPTDGLSTVSFRALLLRCIDFALAGASRLPVTSVETPHPAFTLGLIAYPDGAADPMVRRARAIEARLRAGMSIDASAADLPVALRTLFNQLALSPWTSLTQNLIALILRLDRGAALGLLGYMLRHLARHLNAFDLVRFHNSGANYPDALFLDELLRAYIPLLENDATPMHRRALRVGWLARRRCEGLRVPDRPTSPGDNARSMPGPPVPQVQLGEPPARSKRLFEHEPADALLTPLARKLLGESVEDLCCDAAEASELGAAVFLDRPFGAAGGKREGQADRTVLLSYEAFSLRLGARRIQELCDAGFIDRKSGDLEICRPAGVAVASLPGHARKGVVALEDAKKVTLDFIFTRTTRTSLDEWIAQYDLSSLNAADSGTYQWLCGGRDVLLIRTGRSGMTAVDSSQRRRFALEIPESAQFIECGGIEYVEDLRIVLEDGCRIAIPPRLEA